MSTEIQLLRNATMKIKYGGFTILTDPMFAAEKSMRGYLDRENTVNPTVPLPLSPERITASIDLVLVSHTHIPADNPVNAASDHFDPEAAAFLDGGLPIFIQPSDEKALSSLGFTNLNPVGLEPQSLPLPESGAESGGKTCRISRFPVVHADIPEVRPFLGDSSGYLLESDGLPPLLWCGDAILTGDLLKIAAESKPGIIITHSGGAFQPIDAEGNISRFIMDAGETVRLAETAPEATLIAVHLEALDHCPVGRDELRDAAGKAGISPERILIPADGETIIID